MHDDPAAQSLFRLAAPLRAILDAELAAGNKIIQRTDFLFPLQIDLSQSFHEIYCRVWPLPGVRYGEERDIKACIWEDAYSHGAYSICAPGMDEQTPQDLEQRRLFTALTEKARSEGRLLPAERWRGQTLTAADLAEQKPLCAVQLCDEIEHEMRRLGLWSDAAPPTQQDFAGVFQQPRGGIAARVLEKVGLGSSSSRAGAAPKSDAGDMTDIARWIQFGLIPQARNAAAGSGQFPQMGQVDTNVYVTLDAEPRNARLSRMMYSFGYVFGPNWR